MEKELINLKRKFEIIKNEKLRRDEEFKELIKVKEDPENFINQKLDDFNKKLQIKEAELHRMKLTLKDKETTIRSISIAHTEFKQQLESLREELLFNQSERETLSRKLNIIEKGDSKGALLQNENLREQNKKLLAALMKLLKTEELVQKSSSKRIVKRQLSNSMKNSTILLSHSRKLSSPSPSKKRKSSKRKIKRRKSSSGTRKAKFFKPPKILPNETVPYLAFNQLTPLVRTTKDKNLQMYTQKFRTDKQDLHDARVKISQLQKYISCLKLEITRAKDKYRRLRKAGRSRESIDSSNAHYMSVCLR
jgi:hypothetical protein